MNLLKWLRSHKPASFFAALFLMTLPSAGLYVAAYNGATLWIWIGMIFIILGNIIALLVK